MMFSAVIVWVCVVVELILRLADKRHLWITRGTAQGERAVEDVRRFGGGLCQHIRWSELS